MSTLLREVLDIPVQAGAEDYVLRLTDSIEPERDRPHGGRVRGHARAGRGVRRGARAGRRGADVGGEPGGVPGRVVRVRQEPLHGGAARAAAARPRRPGPRPSCSRSSPGTTTCCWTRRSCRSPSTSSARSRWSRPCSCGYIRQIARLHPGRRCPRCTSPTRSCGTPSGCGPGTGTSAFFAGLNGGAAARRRRRTPGRG